MWPWEHLAAGYLAYSLLVHLTRGRAPHGRLTMAALVVGTQFPDLVDKPLAWAFHVLPSGTSLAHSVFFAVPFALVVIAISRATHRPDAGTAFTIGYLLHLPADVLYVWFYGTPIGWSGLLWPLASKPAQQSPGLLENVMYYFDKFLTVATSSDGMVLLAFELLLVGGALLLWVADDFPGLRGDRLSPRRTLSRN